MSLPRFAFVVHALSPFHRRAIGLRRAAPSIVLGHADGTGAWTGLGRIARFRIDGVAEGEILGIPLDPQQMLEDQERALSRMERVIQVARQRTHFDAIGLGSLCAVVAGRGTALQERLDLPVTTGAAATTWAQHALTMQVYDLRKTSRPIAVVGSAGPVGRAIATMLANDGLAVRVDSKRGGRKLPVEVCSGPADAVHGCDIVVGAGPTGGTLDPAALHPGATLIDVALPDTLTGPPPPGTMVLAGEAIRPPKTWKAGMWGRVYHVLAGYGPGQVYACLVEPLVVAVSGRTTPLAQGRVLKLEDVQQFGTIATELGFRTRLVQGWREVPLDALRG